jgi:hypothetical protein
MLKTQILSVLRRAQDVIRNENNWMQHAFSKGEQYCALGAIDNVCKGNIDEVFLKTIDLLDKTATKMGYGRLEDLNDESSHATVMVMFDLTIKFIEDGLYQCD